MVYLDQQTQFATTNAKQDRQCSIRVTICCGCVTMVESEKQYVVHILSAGLLAYLTNRQIACPVYFYRLLRVWPYYIFHIISQKTRFQELMLLNIN
jgi:hypothetical protein